MQYFPLFVDASNLNCLVVGAGEVAARKVELLLKTPANITVVATTICPTIRTLAESSNLILIERAYIEQDIEEKDLVFAATDDKALNKQISKHARQNNTPINVVDCPELCSFITPSIVDRSPITIAISSGGVAPVLLRYLREKLESLVPHNISQLGKLASKYRATVKNKFSTIRQRRIFWENVFEGEIAEHAMRGNHEISEQLLQNKLADTDEIDERGEVYLVGAGPGDPELLTFKALRLMQRADVVVYDRLVSEPILEMTRRDAEKIYVGKARSDHTLPQQDINQLLADLALQGKRVVRLKGGDPFIFGRGGEELETLVEQNIRFQVVPGITAANGAASYGGIPLTHRDHAQSVVFATGHLKNGTIDLDWDALVQNKQTIVFYMGLTGLLTICERLIAHGMGADMPIALVQSATTDKQKVVTGTLGTMPDKVAKSGIRPPTLIIVGTVVSLQSDLNWFRTPVIS